MEVSAALQIAGIIHGVSMQSKVDAQLLNRQPVRREG
jgi:hypothetical protein